MGRNREEVKMENTTNKLANGVNTMKANLVSGFNKSTNWLKQNQALFIIVVLVVLAFGLFVIISLYRSFKQFTNDNVYLVKGTIETSSNPIVIPANTIPRASDGPYGLEFSYAMWMFINQDSYSATNNTVKKHVLHKGSPNLVPYMCPGVFLGKDKNDIEVHFTTFNYTDEVCTIHNIPIGKWFHFAVVVINKNVDVYINGQLKKRCTLKGLPIQNFGDVFISRDITATQSADASSQPTTTFVHMSGLLSQVRYFSYALPYYRLEQVMNESPADAPPMDTGVMPPYLAPNYYLQSGFPQVNTA